MPDISGSLVTEFQVSTDGDVANYNRLEADLIGNFRYNPGRQTAPRTSGVDSTVNNFPIKANPSLAFTCRPNTDPSGAYSVLVLASAQQRAFTFKIGELRVTAVGNLSDAEGDYDMETGLGQMEFTFTSAGAPWRESREV